MQPFNYQAWNCWQVGCAYRVYVFQLIKIWQFLLDAFCQVNQLWLQIKNNQQTSVDTKPHHFDSIPQVVHLIYSVCARKQELNNAGGLQGLKLTCKQAFTPRCHQTVKLFPLFSVSLTFSHIRTAWWWVWEWSTEMWDVVKIFNDRTI